MDRRGGAAVCRQPTWCMQAQLGSGERPKIPSGLAHWKGARGRDLSDRLVAEGGDRLTALSSPVRVGRQSIKSCCRLVYKIPVGDGLLGAGIWSSLG